MKIPKYIEKKIDRMEKLLMQANSIKYEIESWAEGKGADITSNDWYQLSVDGSAGVNGVSLEGMKEYFEMLEENND